MRLLSTDTGLFREVSNAMDVPYAILSHRWDGPDREQSYQQVCAIQASYLHPTALQHLLFYLGRILLWILPQQVTHFPCISSSAPLANQRTSIALLLLVWLNFVTELTHSWAHPSVLTDPRLSRKIRDACACARAEGHKYLWIDSCCLDKSSSAEMSEAINAMYRWYEVAVVCYAYLSDVHSTRRQKNMVGEFFLSQWHTRGWTLQELLAPDHVIFLSASWKYLGTKTSLASVLYRRLGIPPLVLTKFQPVKSVCVAMVMSWATSRVTTREEDRAYCLMGLFGVHMPTLYGEGNRAFVRLQEAIWERTPDASVFAWNHTQVPTRIEGLDKYSVDLSLDRTIQEYRSRVGWIETRLIDFVSHFATHPGDFLVGRSMKFITPRKFGEYLGKEQNNSGWVIRSPHGIPSPVPYIPMKVLLSLEGAANSKSTSKGPYPLSKLYLIPLPCTWQVRESKEPEGLLAIVCRESLYAAPGADADDELPAHLVHGPTKVLRPVTLHNPKLKRGAGASRLVLLTRADLAKCRASIRPNGSLFCDPHRRAAPSLTRMPPVRETDSVEPAVCTPISVQLADWALTLLRRRGYQVTRLDSLPPGAEPKVEPEAASKSNACATVGTDSDFGADEARAELDPNASNESDAKADTPSAVKEPILGYKLRRKGMGLIIMVQHSPPVRLDHEIVMRVRFGLVETASPTIAPAKAERESKNIAKGDEKGEGGSEAEEEGRGKLEEEGQGEGTTLPQREAWTKWVKVWEGDESAVDLPDPRGKYMFLFRVTVRHQSHAVYNMGLEIFPAALKTPKVAQTNSTLSSATSPSEGAAVGTGEVDADAVGVDKMDQNGVVQSRVDQDGADTDVDPDETLCDFAPPDSEYDTDTDKTLYNM